MLLIADLKHQVVFGSPVVSPDVVEAFTIRGWVEAQVDRPATFVFASAHENTKSISIRK